MARARIGGPETCDLPAIEAFRQRGKVRKEYFKLPDEAAIETIQLSNNEHGR